jgi:hypothetical protein
MFNRLSRSIRSVFNYLRTRLANIFMKKKRTGNTTNKQLIFGIPSEWKGFEERHPLFLERFPHLRDALTTAFIRTGTSSNAIDKFVFLYGRLCGEDFFEVLLCCGNGYGSAGQKLVRSLYERAVTLQYLHEHPAELDDFMDYHYIQNYKLVKPIEETLGAGTIPADVVAESKAKYEEVKERFMVTACEDCGRKRLNYTWNKLDFVSLSRKTGTMWDLIVPGYYLPMRDAHATLASLLSRLEMTDPDNISFIPTGQHLPANHALIAAHNIILKVLGIQDERFKVEGLEAKLKLCVQDFLDIWGNGKGTAPV